GERRVLRAMAGRVEGAEAHVAELELPSVVEGLVVVLGVGVAVDMDGGSGRRGEPAVAGDVVGVVVGLENVLDVDARVAGQLEVLGDLEARVHHRADAGVLVAHEVRRAAEVVVDDLPEDHMRSIIRRSNPEWTRTEHPTSASPTCPATRSSRTTPRSA